MRIEVHHFFHAGDDLAGILQSLFSRNDQIMATVEQLTEAINGAAASVNELTATVASEAAQVGSAIQALKDQIAAGTVQGIDPAALDPVLASVNNLTAAAAAAKSAVEAIYTPAEG